MFPDVNSDISTFLYTSTTDAVSAYTSEPQAWNLPSSGRTSDSCVPSSFCNWKTFWPVWQDGYPDGATGNPVCGGQKNVCGLLGQSRICLNLPCAGDFFRFVTWMKTSQYGGRIENGSDEWTWWCMHTNINIVTQCNSMARLLINSRSLKSSNNVNMVKLWQLIIIATIVCFILKINSRERSVPDSEFVKSTAQVRLVCYIPDWKFLAFCLID